MWRLPAILSFPAQEAATIHINHYYSGGYVSTRSSSVGASTARLVQIVLSVVLRSPQHAPDFLQSAGDLRLLAPVYRAVVLAVDAEVVLSHNPGWIVVCVLVTDAVPQLPCTSIMGITQVTRDGQQLALGHVMPGFANRHRTSV